MDKSHRLCAKGKKPGARVHALLSQLCVGQEKAKLRVEGGTRIAVTLGLGTGGKENVWQFLVEQGTWEETSWGDGNFHHLNLGCDCMVYTYVKKRYCIVQLRLVYFTVCRLQYSIVWFWVLLEYCSVFLLGTLYKAPVFKDLIFF